MYKYPGDKGREGERKDLHFTLSAFLIEQAREML